MACRIPQDVQVAKFELESAQQQLEEAQGAAMLAAEEALQAESVRKRLHAARAASTTHAQDLETARAALATQESLLKGVEVLCAVTCTLCCFMLVLCSAMYT